MIVKKMMHMFTTVGFAYCKNIPDWDEAAHLQLVQEFHNLPQDEKNRLYMHHHNKENNNIYRGLAPILANDPSHKELFDMGYPYRLVGQS